MSEASRRSPGRSGSALRRVLDAGFVLFAGASRLLERISPHLSDLLRNVTERAYELQQETRIARRDVITMHAGETRFRLCLVGGHRIAHSDYLPLAETGEAYEPVASACLARLLGGLPDPVFVDIGAFIGYFTCYAAALLRDRQPVYAVESNPVFCEAIRQAVALNGFRHVRVLRAALADQAGAVIIDDTAVLPANGPGVERPAVQAVTFDDLCASEGISPTILKIDVHGAEGAVLRGMQRVCRESVDVVLLELHALHLYQPHSPEITRLDLLDLLEELGFSIFYLAGHRWEKNSGIAPYLQQGRFAYLPLTRQTRQFLLFDRPLDVLVLASKLPDIADLLGPSVDVSAAVG